MSNMALPARMKAQLLEAYNEPYIYSEVPLPQLTSPNDILIKLSAAGYCHTDAVVAAGQMKPNPPQFPHIGSHELAGTVVALHSSPSEAAKQLSIGTRVGAPGRGYGACGSCFECKDPSNERAGHSNMCPQGLSNGISKTGGFAEYAVVDARQVASIPDSMPATDAAPLMCAGVTIYNALKRCELSPNQHVGIIGCGGGLGHLGLQFAEAMGLRITGVDAADAPLELARSLGTKAHIVDARAVKAEDLVLQIGAHDLQSASDRGNMGLDAVIILPENQASFDYGVTLLRNHGLCVVVSFPEEGFRVSARDLVFRDISVKGTILGTNAVLRETVEVASRHGVRVVKKCFALEDLNGLVEEYGKGEGGKLVVDFEL